MSDWLQILLVNALVLTLIIAISRFFFVPIWKKRKKIRALAYCPSIELPPFPETTDEIIEVPSNRRDKVYKVNLFWQTCTCRRHRARRRFFPHQDVRRLCRHLRKEVLNAKKKLAISDMLVSVIEKKVRDRCYEAIEVLKTPVVIGFHPRTDFVRVHSRKRMPNDPPDGPLTGKYDKFTLVVSQESWVYGTPPPGGDEIIDTTKALLKKYRTIRKAKNRKW